MAVSKYSMAPMRILPWATPNLDPTYLNVPQGAWPSTGLGDPHFVMTIDWEWPTDTYWSHYMIVRSVRSPARRAEEGQWMFSRPMRKSDHSDYRYEGTPFFTDPQPPPGEWTFYTMFFLDSYRVWCPGGFVYDMSPADHDWTLRLPELVPGAGVSVEQGVTHPADQASDLVQFLQGPGVFLDMTVSMAEAVQFFWDPLRVPPQLLASLARSWGYKYDDTLGPGRAREVLAVIRRTNQGSLQAVGSMVDAASGSESAVLMSDNLMLSIADSSFEVPSGAIEDTSWDPLYTTVGNESTKLRIYTYVDNPDPDPIAPPNIQVSKFLNIPTARTIYCGYRPAVAPATGRVLDPVGRGIPVAGWTKVRMGCYAVDYTGAQNDCTIKTGIDLYDYNGVKLDSLQVTPTTGTKALNGLWAWYGSGSGGVADSVPIVLTQPDYSKSDVLTNVSLWTSGTYPPYAGPQTAPTVSSGMRLTWATAPTNNTDIGFQGVATFTEALHQGWTYRISITVKASASAASWRPRLAGGVAGETVAPDAATTPVTLTFDWECDGRASPTIGVETLRPAAGWGSAGTHTVTAFSVKRIAAPHAYGVPWITVSNACWIDLVVVDDGL